MRPGPRLTFVQVALPPGCLPSDSLGKVEVNTYWRSIERKTGAIGQIISGSYIGRYPDLNPIVNPLLSQKATKFSYTSVEDLHNGQLAIAVNGNFLPGSYVRIGSQKLSDWSSGLLLEDQKLTLSVSTALLATAPAMLVSRDGTETQLSLGDCAQAPQVSATSKLVDETHAIVQIAFCKWPEASSPQDTEHLLHAPDEIPLLLIIGGKVYGPHDNILRNGETLSVITPVADLFTSPRLTVMPLFVADSGDIGSRIACTASEDLIDFVSPNLADKFTFLGTNEQKGESSGTQKAGDQAKATYVLLGSRLKGSIFLFPIGTDINWCPFVTSAHTNVAEDTAMKLEIPLTLIDENGLQVLLQKKDQELITLQLPGPPKKGATSTTNASPIKVREPIVVGADQATITGPGLTDVKKVWFGKTEILSEQVKDGTATSLMLKGLVVSKASTYPGSKNLTLDLSNGKTLSVILDVVSNITETLQSQPH